MLRRACLTLALSLMAACDGAKPLAPLSELPYALATNSCGPTDAPIVVIYLASQPFESGQPVAPFVEIRVPASFSELGPDEVFPIGEIHTAANAWFHGSGVQTRMANGGEVGVTTAASVMISGHVDLQFVEGARIRGTFIAAWQPRQLLCG